MTSTPDRLMELLTDRALTGLGQREQIELAELLVQAQDVDVATFDRAAAAVALSAVAPLSRMPASLASRLEETLISAMDRRAPRIPSDAAQTTVDEVYEASSNDLHDASGVARRLKQTVTMPDRPAPPAEAPRPSWGPSAQLPGARGPVSYAPPSISAVPHASAPPSNVVPLAATTRSATKGASRGVAIGGWIAAAACLVLAIGAFATRKPATPVAIRTTAPTVSAQVAPPASAVAAKITPAQLRDKLLASASTTRATWDKTKDPLSGATSGDVVWNKEQQQGVMRFQGLARNDPTRAQYQLWIFDKDRDAKYPVDGGVFDVDADTGDVLVAIHATLPVEAPVLFAVTLEQPGGVVVSKRDRLVVTAKPVAG